jgi:hypothetical protein
MKLKTVPNPLQQYRSACCLVMAFLLTGCAAAPHADVDVQKLARIKTVAVSAPHKTVYSVGTSSGPLIIPGGGILAAAIGGAVSGSINASTNKHAATFNDLVTAKVGDTHLYRRFVDGIEAELRNQGYVVSEVDLSQDGMPKVVMKGATAELVGPKYEGADAILIMNVGVAYYAPGPMNAFSRQVVGEISMFETSDYTKTFRQPVRLSRFDDPYSYGTYSSLVDDLPHAIQGLDESMMSLVPQFGALLKSARQTVQVSGQTDVKAQ